MLGREEEHQSRIENILGRHTPKSRSDEYGHRELSLADRLQIMSMDLCRLQVECEANRSFRDEKLMMMAKEQHYG